MDAEREVPFARHTPGWLRACVKQPDWRRPGAAKIFSRPALALTLTLTLTLAASSTLAKSDTDTLTAHPPPPTFLASLPLPALAPACLPQIPPAPPVLDFSWTKLILNHHTTTSATCVHHDTLPPPLTYLLARLHHDDRYPAWSRLYLTKHAVIHTSPTWPAITCNAHNQRWIFPTC